MTDTFRWILVALLVLVALDLLPVDFEAVMDLLGDLRGALHRGLRVGVCFLSHPLLQIDIARYGRLPLFVRQWIEDAHGLPQRTRDHLGDYARTGPTRDRSAR